MYGGWKFFSNKDCETWYNKLIHIPKTVPNQIQQNAYRNSVPHRKHQGLQGRAAPFSCLCHEISQLLLSKERPQLCVPSPKWPPHPHVTRHFANKNAFYVISTLGYLFCGDFLHFLETPRFIHTFFWHLTFLLLVQLRVGDCIRRYRPSHFSGGFRFMSTLYLFEIGLLFFVFLGVFFFAFASLAFRHQHN